MDFQTSKKIGFSIQIQPTESFYTNDIKTYELDIPPAEHIIHPDNMSIEMKKIVQLIALKITSGTVIPTTEIISSLMSLYCNYGEKMIYYMIDCYQLYGVLKNNKVIDSCEKKEDFTFQSLCKKCCSN